jgi:hypothetical protein
VTAVCLGLSLQRLAATAKTLMIDAYTDHFGTNPDGTARRRNSVRNSRGHNMAPIALGARSAASVYERRSNPVARPV